MGRIGDWWGIDVEFLDKLEKLQDSYNTTLLKGELRSDVYKMKQIGHRKKDADLKKIGIR